jgi:hypothetical protein
MVRVVSRYANGGGMTLRISMPTWAIRRKDGTCIGGIMIVDIARRIVYTSPPNNITRYTHRWLKVICQWSLYHGEKERYIGV